MTWTAEQQRARYYALKAARLCVSCRAGLQYTDAVRCVECETANRRTPRATASRRAASRRAYWRDPEKHRAARRARHTRKLLAGECTLCPRPAAAECNLCDQHQTSERARIKDVARRRRGRREIERNAPEVTP